MIHQKDINELIDAGVISVETGRGISDFYSKKDTSNSKLIIVFGILGAILVGLGIILVIAHNWDMLPISVKSIIAFIPLLIGQGAGMYTLLRKYESPSWVEGACTFLYLAIGSSISMISQIYSLNGDFSTFILVWTLLGCGLIYIMKSSISSALYIIGITVYSISVAQLHTTYIESIWYWPLLLIAIPHYIYLAKFKPTSNFTFLHHWIVPVSLCCVLWTFYIDYTKDFMFVNYVALFGLLYLVGSMRFFQGLKTISNGFKVIGFFGSLAVMFILSFDAAYEELSSIHLTFDSFFLLPLILFILIMLGSIFMIRQQSAGSKIEDIPPLKYLFLIIATLFFSNLNTFLSVLIVNLLILFLGVHVIKAGMKNNHLLKVNVGLLIISLLIMCRFFDTNINFVFKGLLFVSLGVGFFMANYLMLKKPSTHE